MRADGNTKMIVEKISRAIQKPFKLSHNRREFRRLLDTGDPQMNAIAEAAETAFNRQLDPGETIWRDRIETLRAELLTNTNPIESSYFSDPAEGLSESLEKMVTTVSKACQVSRGGRSALILMRLVRCLKPTQCLELGTNIGISAAYQGAALELNAHGQLTTMDGNRSKAQLAQQNWQRLGITRNKVVTGIFRNTLQPTLEQLASVDFAFIDGHHDGNATLQYYEQIANYTSPGSIFVFDDTRYSNTMIQAWNVLSTMRGFRCTIDFGRYGLCVAGEPNEKPLALSLKMV